MLKTVWNADSIIKKVNRKAADIITDAANVLLAESQEQVPLDKGTLQDSGDIDVKNDDKAGIHEATVFYDTKYARRLHEHPEYRFQHGRKGKYLQDPAKELESTFERYVKDELSDLFED